MEIIRRAKSRGVKVTAETAPHYFSLTHEAVRGFNTNAKMSPPLRTAADVAAIKIGLADGTLDCIATDHAPHSVLEKEVEFDRAANGIIGLETALGLSLELVREGVLTLAQLIARTQHQSRPCPGGAGGDLAAGGAGGYHGSGSGQTLDRGRAAVQIQKPELALPWPATYRPGGNDYCWGRNKVSKFKALRKGLLLGIPSLPKTTLVHPERAEGLIASIALLPQHDIFC